MQILTESTPNPNAMKFILENNVKNEGSSTFKSKEDSGSLPLARAFFETSPNVTEVYLNDNYITITQDGDTSWESLEGKIRSAIEEKINEHDPNFLINEETQAQEEAREITPEFQKVTDIINEDIRPALQMHGGDISVLSVLGKKVVVSYQGACGSCPSAAMGTLYAIKGVLEEKFDPKVEVELG